MTVYNLGYTNEKTEEIEENQYEFHFFILYATAPSLCLS